MICLLLIDVDFHNKNFEKDQEIVSLKKENLLLKQQKESLMTALR